MAYNKIASQYEIDTIFNEEEMNKIFKKTFILLGLDCGNCAAKIENNIKNLKGVKDVKVDFVSRKLVLQASSKEELSRIIEEAKDIVKKIEPHVKVISQEEIFNETKKKDNNKKFFMNVNNKEIFIFAIGGVLFTLGLFLNLSETARLIIFLVSYILFGGEILLRAFKNIIRGQVFDENFLMSIATIGAFLIGEYPEAVGVMLFYKVGEFFQELAVNRSRRSISELMDIRPDFANLKIGNDIKKVSPDKVKIGDIIVVKPGEKIPLDGKVIEGNSMVDTSPLTGESLPREVTVGKDVLSGFINKNGKLIIEVTKEFHESTVSKILDLVENAGSRKAATENFITKFAKYYTPLVVAISVIIAFLPPIIIADATFSDWFYRALIFLVISCPCALVISIPLGFFGGIGGASKKGILIKGANYLEALNHVETVVFDKTGTLTKGIFKVTEIKPYNSYKKETLLEYAAYAEVYSNHPIAISILNAYGKDIDRSKIKGYEEILGHGIKIEMEDKTILIGNKKLMERENISYVNTEVTATTVHVAVDNEYIGYIVISDEVREDSKKTIETLKNMGIKKTVMLTGDLKAIGEKVGKELGLDEIYAELLPNEKVEKLEMLDSQKSSKGKLIFVGDGINDAPVLARGDIGIAMGGLGSDAAIEAADIVIMTDEPSKIPIAIKIAQKTRKIVWQNIILSIGVKAIFLVLGALGAASLWEAVFADVGVSVIAIFNAIRVMKVENI